VVGEGLRVQGHRRKNVAEMVGATHNECFSSFIPLMVGMKDGHWPLVAQRRGNSAGCPVYLPEVAFVHCANVLIVTH